MGKSQPLAYAERAAAVIAEERNAVGRIKKGYGTITLRRGEAERQYDGALLVTLFDTFPEVAETAEPLWIEIDSLAVPLFISSFERRGGSSGTTAVVLFEDFERATEAELLVGKVLYRAASTADGRSTGRRAEDETEFEALIGYELTDRTTGRRGIVVAFYDYPGNPLLGVEFDGREVMVPAADELVEVVSTRRKQLRAQLPEGLFEL
jgi:16S rRNA processing protein RimM